MSDLFGEHTPITPSERELVLYLAKGYRVREAALPMGLTVGTARNYATRLRTKLGVKHIDQIPGAYMALTGEDPYDAAAWIAD